MGWECLTLCCLSANMADRELMHLGVWMMHLGVWMRRCGWHHSRSCLLSPDLRLTYSLPPSHTLRSMDDRYNILDIDSLAARNRELTEEVMRLHQENFELSRCGEHV